MNKVTVKTLKVVGAIVLLVLAGDICHEWYKLKPYNEAPLNITTFDGTNSPYHPSVMYFKDGWNKYKYWMAETPFYPYTQPYHDRNECPCIHVSNDGIHWTEVSKNPLDDLDSTGVRNFDYFSDPHLVKDGDTLECWYRINKRHGDIKDHHHIYLLCKKTTDGVNWSEADTLFLFKDLQEKEMVSPAVLHPDSSYQMWYVDNKKVFYAQSNNPKDWKNPQQCQLKGYDECIPWHIDVVNVDGYYWLLIYDLKHTRLSLWKGTEKTSFEYVKTILDPSNVCGSFYQSTLYRSCMLKESDKNYKIYFSAFNEELTFLGLMEGTSFEDMHIVNVDDKNYSGFAQFLKYYFLSRWRSLSFRIRHVIK